MKNIRVKTLNEYKEPCRQSNVGVGGRKKSLSLTDFTNNLATCPHIIVTVTIANMIVNRIELLVEK